MSPDDIDVLVLSTTTPDQAVPATSASVQRELGLRCGAFDINAACSGFVYALVVAHGLIGMGLERVLVIGTDTLSRITDWDDRNTAVLFADGAGAVVLEACEGPGQLLGWDLGADGEAQRLLYADIGGYIQMDGKEVFRRAVRVMVDSARHSLDIAGVSVDDITLVVPHQANIRIIKAACERLGVPMDRAPSFLHRTGNTSSASIPLALVDAIDAGRVARRRPCAPRRLRRRHDRCERGVAVGTPVSRVVLVTGGARGIGLACAERFAALGDQVAVTYNTSPPPGDFLAVPCDVRDAAAVDDGVPHRRGAIRTRRGARVERGHHQGHAPLADERGRLHERRRHEPGRRLSREQAGGARHAARPPGAHHPRQLGRRSAAGRPARRTTRRRRRGSSASLARSPVSSAAATSPSTWSRPGRSSTDMTAVLSDDLKAQLTSQVAARTLRHPRRGRGRRRFLASADAAYITGAVLPVDGGLGMGH